MGFVGADARSLSASCRRPARAVRQANSTAATAVARFRLETPVAHRDPDARSARARSSSLSPWRSVPKASTARGVRSAGSQRLAVRVQREQRTRDRARAPRRLSSARHRQGEVQAGGAPQRVGMPRVVAAGGRARPAASAAAATRTQAPMLPRSRGSSSRTTGAGRGAREQLRHRSCGGRSAIAITRGAGRQRGELLEDLARSTRRASAPACVGRGRGRARAASCSQLVGVAGDEQLERSRRSAARA